MQSEGPLASRSRCIASQVLSFRPQNQMGGICCLLVQGRFLPELRGQISSVSLECILLYSTLDYTLKEFLLTVYGFPFKGRFIYTYHTFLVLESQSASSSGQKAISVQNPLALSHRPGFSGSEVFAKVCWETLGGITAVSGVGAERGAGRNRSG